MRSTRAINFNYVGLASGLVGRLKSHRKNRHGEAWDRFSVYLTVKAQHTKEIESLVLQIASPKGNAIGGKPAGSKDMLRAIKRAVRQKQDREVTALFERRLSRNRQPSKIKQSSRAGSKDQRTLQKLLPKGARLRAILHGKTYSARARKDGRIRFDGKIYNSLSSAAGKIRKRPSNGWWLWRVERGRGNWVRLQEVRRAGTALV